MVEWYHTVQLKSAILWCNPAQDATPDRTNAKGQGEVETTKKPRAIKRDERIVAVLSPVKPDKRKAIAETLALAGAWKDLPSDHMEEELDRIRHASKLTPPLDLDV